MRAAPSGSSNHEGVPCELNARDERKDSGAGSNVNGSWTFSNCIGNGRFAKGATGTAGAVLSVLREEAMKDSTEYTRCGGSGRSALGIPDFQEGAAIAERAQASRSGSSITGSWAGSTQLQFTEPAVAAGHPRCRCGQVVRTLGLQPRSAAMLSTAERAACMLLGMLLCSAGSQECRR